MEHTGNPRHRPARRTTTASLFALAAVLVAGCAPSPDASRSRSGTSSTSVSSPTITTVAADLQTPWSIAFHGGSALLSERDSARIVELTADGARREVGILAGVTPVGEGGLLGIAVRDNHLFVYSTAGDQNRVERYPLTGAAGSLRLGEPQAILTGLAAATYHNGGRIAFGPDGMLYVTVGDAGNRAAAQDRDSTSGKILRLTPDGKVPADNPFDGSPVFSWGHRNPQGLAWDADGTMYATEFGQNTWDELNVISAGRNYGWPIVEGIANDDRFVDPVQQWVPTDASPSGMAIVGGSIWIANLRGERLREVPLRDTTASSEHLVGNYGRLRDAVVAPDGALWVLTNNTDGRGVPGTGDDRILRFRPD